MRFKTYLSTYLLFLFILFSCFGIVSTYMTNTQINMSTQKCTVEYQTIATSLIKDITTLYRKSENFSEDINKLMNNYIEYYKKNNITLELVNSMPSEDKSNNRLNSEISFIKKEKEHFIFINITLPEPFQNYRINYYYNITKTIADMKNVQNTLLFICIIFSIITAFALYFILLKIFFPLEIVSNASRKIANGKYNERIYVKGNNELSAMAFDFNQMAEKIESQIYILEEETIGKQRFIDNFAHEIRTPLTSIYGYAEYMQKALLDEGEIIELTQFIMDRTTHIKKIASSLLQLTTLRNYTPIKSEIQIKPLFEDIYKTIKKSASKQKIKFMYKIETDILLGQEDLIKSLILNLCFNALKSCSENDGIICLDSKKQGENIILSVTDNGYGIPEESLLKVTEPFYRVDKSRSREQGGTGLGLTLCKQISEVHGAEIIIDSAIGKGTTVKVIFTSS